jgi:hypothetical protein
MIPYRANQHLRLISESCAFSRFSFSSIRQTSLLVPDEGLLHDPIRGSSIKVIPPTLCVSGVFCFLPLSNFAWIRQKQKSPRLRRKDNFLLRRKRDSNPRSSHPDNGFQDRRIRPLCHFSIRIKGKWIFEK